jgi:hypothetical protein
VSRRLAATLVSLALALAVPAAAIARSEKTVDYAAAKVWPTAVRYLRVDAGVKITEKDADAGYVMFELVDEGKTYAGALELVVADDDGGPRCRIAIHINDRPSYMEAVMLEKLEHKLHADHGTPPPRRPPPEKKQPDKKPAAPAPEPAPADPAKP